MFCKCSLMAWFQPWPGKVTASDRWGAVFHTSSCQLSLFWLRQEKCCLLEYFKGGWKKTLKTWLKCDFFFLKLITVRFSIPPTQISQQYLLMRNNYVSILSDTSAIVYTKCENLVRHGAYAERDNAWESVLPSQGAKPCRGRWQIHVFIYRL